MEVGKTINVAEEDIKKKKFNIFIPLSLGNKWFVRENIASYIEWGLEYSKSDVLIVVADKLHQINVEVKDHYKPEKAKRKVDRIAKRIRDDINTILEALTAHERRRVHLICWEEIESNKYDLMKRSIYGEFERNPLFRKAVLAIVQGSIDKLKNRTFTDSEILRLSQYVLDELPVFLYGADYAGITYTLHPYPVFTRICELVGKIQEGQFRELYRELGSPQGRIVELRVAQ